MRTRVQLVDHAGARSGHTRQGRADHRAAGQRPVAGQGAAVGALFDPGPGGKHFCTGTVVHSPARDLMITAAHCVNPAGHRRQFVFVPGYRDGRAPYGVWRPRQFVVDSSWTNSADPAADVAFVILYPSHRRNIGDVVVGQDIGRTAAFGGLARMVGYPDKAQEPVSCDNTISYVDQRLEFDCPGFTAGTSGSPWLAGIDDPDGAVRIVGVLGGYQDGGTSPSVSYSPVFGANVINLYRQAVRRGRELAARR